MSTFESTPEGDTGPVLAALARALDAPRTVVVPGFPGAGRRVFMGHLFVNDRLLSRSRMETHPLTPMTEPDLRIWLARQTDLPVAHVAVDTLRAGSAAIRAERDRLQSPETTLVVMDTVDDDDLRAIGAAVAGDALVSGGSGLGLGLPANFDGLDPAQAAAWKGNPRRAVALAGSCSPMTRDQVRTHAGSHPVLHLDPIAIAEDHQTPKDSAHWAWAQPADSVPLVTSTMAPEGGLHGGQPGSSLDRPAAARSDPPRCGGRL